MAQEADDVLRECLLLKDEVERQRRLIEELTRPRHWSQDGPRGKQATAIHQALDRMLERVVKVRNRIRPGSPAAMLQAEPTREGEGDSPIRDACDARLRQAADLLGATSQEGPALDGFIAAAHESDRPRSQIAWLGLTAVLGRYPTSTELDRAARSEREGGASALADFLRQAHLDALSTGDARPNLLGVRTRAVIVDVTHTARIDLHTGIQRVVREAASRWLNDERALLVWWDDQGGFLRELGRLETFRFREWSQHLPTMAESTPIVRNFDDTPQTILVPWDCKFVLPELAADPDRSSCYCALAASAVIQRLGVIGFDLVPVTASETVHSGMVGVFNTHLSVLKHADRLSAISESAANEFRSFGQALSAQGLTGPVVEAHVLPPSPFEVSDEALESVRSSLDGSDRPVVLVVGSREPRKNQITILEAVRHLWLGGQRFHLVMVGGSGWNSTDVDDAIDRARAIGVDVIVRNRATESELFAWYRIARFSVFPSLYEGFGLPIAESLEVGTPVITSNYGAMSEVAALGGAVMIDPRDPAQLRDAMEQLLTDDELIAKLRTEALGRTWPTWDAYAADVWHHLVESDEPSTI